MSLNTMIAQGYTGASPVQRYQEGRKFAATENRNMLLNQATRQGMQAQDQQMQMRGQQMTQNAQAFDMKKGDAYGKAVAPILKQVSDSKDPQAAYTAAMPTIKQLAGQYGIPTDKMPNQFDQQMTDALLFKYMPKEEAPKTRTVMEDAEKVQQEWRGGKWNEVGRGISSKQTGEPGSFGSTKSSRAKIKKERADAEKNLNKHTRGTDRLIELVGSDDFQGGIAGDINASINSLSSQFSQTIGQDSIMNEDGRINWSQVDPKSKQMSNMRKRAINKGSYDATLIELAYLKAKAVDPSSKITDKDFNFAKRMLQSGADKAVLLNMLKDDRKLSIENYDRDEQLTSRRYTDIGYQPMLWDEQGYQDASGVSPDLPAAPQTVQEKAKSKASSALKDMGF